VITTNSSTLKQQLRHQANNFAPTKLVKQENTGSKGQTPLQEVSLVNNGDIKKVSQLS
jgi:hypothetical protein